MTDTFDPRPASWLWLSDLETFDVALLVGDHDPALVRALAGLFRVVLVVGRGSPPSENVRFIGADPRRLPFRREVCDLAALDGLELGGAAPGVLECRRVLKPGGWLAAAWPNPVALLARRDYISFLWSLADGIDRIASREGFGSTRTYYRGPSYVVPARRRALLAVAEGRLRRSLAWLGLHRLAFPRLVMARK